jgi:hypothetical protein
MAALMSGTPVQVYRASGSDWPTDAISIPGDTVALRLDATSGANCWGLRCTVRGHLLPAPYARSPILSVQMHASAVLGSYAGALVRGPSIGEVEARCADWLDDPLLAGGLDDLTAGDAWLYAQPPATAGTASAPAYSAPPTPQSQPQLRHPQHRQLSGGISHEFVDTGPSGGPGAVPIVVTNTGHADPQLFQQFAYPRGHHLYRPQVQSPQSAHAPLSQHQQHHQQQQQQQPQQQVNRQGLASGGGPAVPPLPPRTATSTATHTARGGGGYHHVRPATSQTAASFLQRLPMLSSEPAALLHERAQLAAGAGGALDGIGGESVNVAIRAFTAACLHHAGLGAEACFYAETLSELKHQAVPSDQWPAPAPAIVRIWAAGRTVRMMIIRRYQEERQQPGAAGSGRDTENGQANNTEDGGAPVVSYNSVSDAIVERALFLLRFVPAFVPVAPAVTGRTGLRTREGTPRGALKSRIGGRPVSVPQQPERTMVPLVSPSAAAGNNPGHGHNGNINNSTTTNHNNTNTNNNNNGGGVSESALGTDGPSTAHHGSGLARMQAQYIRRWWSSGKRLGASAASNAAAAGDAGGSGVAGGVGTSVGGDGTVVQPAIKSVLRFLEAGMPLATVCAAAEARCERALARARGFALFEDALARVRSPVVRKELLAALSTALSSAAAEASAAAALSSSSNPNNNPNNPNHNSAASSININGGSGPGPVAGPDRADTGSAGSAGPTGSAGSSGSSSASSDAAGSITISPVPVSEVGSDGGRLAAPAMLTASAPSATARAQQAGGGTDPRREGQRPGTDPQPNRHYLMSTLGSSALLLTRLRYQYLRLARHLVSLMATPLGRVCVDVLAMGYAGADREAMVDMGVLGGIRGMLSRG